MNEPQNRRDAIPPKTLIVPCRDLKPMAAFEWLRAGWNDFSNATGVSLVYGLFVFSVTAMVALGAWKLGGFVLLIAVLSGFVFIAPLLAFGLYSVSRCLCEGKQPELGYTFRAIKRPFSNGMVYTLALLISALTIIGFLTAGIGLIIIIPWLAYATWHGYRATLDVSEWSVIPRESADSN